MNKPLKRIRRMEKAVSRFKAMRLLYNYGGGRVGGRMLAPQRKGEAWSDCSGLSQLLLAVGGVPLREPAGSTWSLAEEGRAGEGKNFTLFIKNAPGDEHVINRHRRRLHWVPGLPKYRWSECGGSDNPQAGGGPAWFRPSEARIAEFPIRRHFPELER